MRPLSQELKDTKRMARIGIDIALMRLVLLDIVTVMTNVNNSMLISVLNVTQFSEHNVSIFAHEILCIVNCLINIFKSL